MPGFRNVSVYGAVGAPRPADKTRNTPELRTSLLLLIVLPPCGSSAEGSIVSRGALPTHQNGTPAASLSAGWAEPGWGTMKGGFWFAPGNVTVWKPRNCQVRDCP